MTAQEDAVRKLAAVCVSIDVARRQLATMVDQQRPAAAAAGVEAGLGPRELTERVAALLVSMGQESAVPSYETVRADLRTVRRRP